ncbi:hypothetical protein Tco_0565642 [Tanacetum coccineum]
MPFHSATHTSHMVIMNLGFYCFLRSQPEQLHLYFYALAHCKPKSFPEFLDKFVIVSLMIFWSSLKGNTMEPSERFDAITKEAKTDESDRSKDFHGLAVIPQSFEELKQRLVSTPILTSSILVHGDIRLTWMLSKKGLGVYSSASQKDDGEILAIFRILNRQTEIRVERRLHFYGRFDEDVPLSQATLLVDRYENAMWLRCVKVFNMSQLRLNTNVVTNEKAPVAPGKTKGKLILVRKEFIPTDIAERSSSEPRVNKFSLKVSPTHPEDVILHEELDLFLDPSRQIMRNKTIPFLVQNSLEESSRAGSHLGDRGVYTDFLSSFSSMILSEALYVVKCIGENHAPKDDLDELASGNSCLPVAMLENAKQPNMIQKSRIFSSEEELKRRGSVFLGQSFYVDPEVSAELQNKGPEMIEVTNEKVASPGKAKEAQTVRRVPRQHRRALECQSGIYYTEGRRSILDRRTSYEEQDDPFYQYTLEESSEREANWRRGVFTDFLILHFSSMIWFPHDTHDLSAAFIIIQVSRGRLGLESVRASQEVTHLASHFLFVRQTLDAAILSWAHVF